MPPKSILKKKTVPGRTATGKRARPGQNIRKAAKAEAESAKAKGKHPLHPKRAGVPGPAPGETGRERGTSGTGPKNASAGVGTGRASRSKGSVKIAVDKSKSKSSDVRKGKKRVPVEQNDMSGDDDDEEEDEDEEMGAGTDEEIERLQDTKSASTGTKRKRPTTASEFGNTLTSLLGDLPSTSDKPDQRPKPKSQTQAQPILSLSRTRLPPSKSALALERKAEEAVKRAKVERIERARVTDVMEGWDQPGGSQEFERGLRKVAQRGVIKLFNAILSASKSAEEGQTMAEQAGWKEEKGKRKEKDNVLGRGGKEALTKEGFLDMVRKG